MRRTSPQDTLDDGQSTACAPDRATRRGRASWPAVRQLRVVFGRSHTIFGCAARGPSAATHRTGHAGGRPRWSSVVDSTFTRESSSMGKSLTTRRDRICPDERSGTDARSFDLNFLPLMWRPVQHRGVRNRVIRPQIVHGAATRDIFGQRRHHWSGSTTGRPRCPARLEALADDDKPQLVQVGESGLVRGLIGSPTSSGHDAPTGLHPATVMSRIWEARGLSRGR